MARAHERYAWVLLLALGILLILSALFITVVAAPDEGDQLTFGVSWAELQSSEPGAARLISFLFRILGFAWLGLALFVTVVSFTSYRRGDRWAWYALWIFPIVLGLFVATVFAVGNTALALYYLVVVIVSLLGLLLPYRRFFPKSSASQVT